MSEHGYRGQWIGTSDSGSHCILNINDHGPSIDGRVSLFETVPIGEATQSIWTMAYFNGTKNQVGEVRGTVNPPLIYWKDGRLQTDSEMKDFQEKSGISFPLETNFQANQSGQYKIEALWESKYPEGGVRNDRVVLEKRRLGVSTISHQSMSWDDFKSYCSKNHDGHIYRGQARDWRLQTSFHRTGHADLIAYLDEKVPELENHINAFSRVEYNASDDRSLGGLLNLAQHHGYPTPLLDWTRSPFVAAFFAFADADRIKNDDTVSVFVFNDSEWSAMAGRYVHLRSPSLSVRTMELPGYGNARVLPQQSVTMFSNVDDIEDIVKQNENSPGQYLSAISIPSNERLRALKDLHLMGITWGSLFPGVEGVCKQLSERHFREK